MAETSPTTEVLSNSTFTVDVPAGYHCIVTGVFYGRLRKGIKVTNLSAIEVLANHVNCYEGWYSCGVISARQAPVTLEVEVHCVDLNCGMLGLTSQIPVNRTGDIGATTPDASVHWYMYTPSGLMTDDRVGITIVVQSGLGPIDVGTT